MTQDSGEFIGEVKERRTFTVVVDGEPQLIETDWGPTHLYRFEDEEGNTLVWFASSKQNMNPGETYLIKATIKRHAEFRGRNQTQLTRVKVIGQGEFDRDAGNAFDDLCREHGVEVRRG